MKISLLGSFLLLIFNTLKAQESIIHRVILIGDAGEINQSQTPVIENASEHVLQGKTTTLFLGDNIYPAGIGLPGSLEEEETKKILQSQFVPMRNRKAPVYFIPGNHDWNKGKLKGLEKIKRQWAYLESQGDSLLKMVPANGCPDPVEIDLSDSLAIIAFDSEWWVYKHDKKNPDAGCKCVTKEEIINRFKELLQKNRHKVILLASHHPFQSYGVHGGYFSLKDHLFPFTAVNKNLYIPLPVIGSLYPLLRTLFISPQDMGHPLYRDMIVNIENVFEDFPNVIYVAGHEHGLQLIKKAEQLQVISGSGAKLTAAKKGKHSLFAESFQGYVIADFLKGNNIRFTFYKYNHHRIDSVFSYTKPYKPVEIIKEQTIP